MKKQFPLEQIDGYNVERAIFEVSMPEIREDTIEKEDVKSWPRRSEGRRFKLCSQIKSRFQMLVLEMKKKIVVHCWCWRKSLEDTMSVDFAGGVGGAMCWCKKLLKKWNIFYGESKSCLANMNFAVVMLIIKYFIWLLKFLFENWFDLGNGFSYIKKGI